MTKSIAVIGLGDFGGKLALFLTERDIEVCGIDDSPERVQEYSEKLDSCIRMNTTDEDAIREHNFAEYDAVVVCIGSNFEAAVLTCSLLKAQNIKRLIARATSPTRRLILRTLGVDKIVMPVEEAALSLAVTLSTESAISTIRLSDDFLIVDIKAPKNFIKIPVIECGIKTKYDLSIVTVKKVKTHILTGEEYEEMLGIPSAMYRFEENDILVIFGHKKNIERFVELTQE